MTNNLRDTQFAGFADALAKELDREVAGIGIEEWTPTRTMTMRRRIIARRAYDLVRHTLENASHINLDRLGIDEHVECIPDMPALPETQE